MGLLYRWMLVRNSWAWDCRSEYSEYFPVFDSSILQSSYFPVLIHSLHPSSRPIFHISISHSSSLSFVTPLVIFYAITVYVVCPFMYF